MAYSSSSLYKLDVLFYLEYNLGEMAHKNG